MTHPRRRFTATYRRFTVFFLAVAATTGLLFVAGPASALVSGQTSVADSDSDAYGDIPTVDDASSDGSSQMTEATQVAPSGQIVYRFWSPENRSHFFTISLEERDHVILNYPASAWTYEGAAYEAYTSQVDGTVPLYRFWSPAFRGHFFTTNTAERDAVIDEFDDQTWTYEGVAYYVYPQDTTVTGVLDVARFWSPENRHHFYTANASEAEYVRASYPERVWTYEGIDFRVPSTLATPPPPPVRPEPPTPSPPTPTQPGNPGDSKNCSDFATYPEAKAWFDQYYPYYGDVAKLDQDNDQMPCESLPGGPR